MLLRKNLRRHHYGSLVAGSNRSVQTNRGYDGFSRTDISLQKAIHRERLLHVVQDFVDYLLLRIRKLERKSSDELADFVVVNGMNDAVRLLKMSGAVSLELQLKKEQLLVYHSAPGFLAFPGVLGMVNARDRFLPRNKRMLLQDLLGKNLGNMLAELRHRTLDQLADGRLRNASSYGIHGLQRSRLRSAPIREFGIRYRNVTTALVPFAR